MEKDDFIRWIRTTDTRTGKISGGFAWSDVAWQRNTNRGYTQVQDLAAVFFNAYSYIEEQFKKFYNKTHEIPYTVLNDEIFEFRKHFPKRGRIADINYYDDLIELLIEKYRQGKKTNNNDQKVKHLIEAFADVSKYKEIVKFLGDNGICRKGSLKLIDDKKNWKRYTASLIKHLRDLGYFQPGLVITNDIIVDIIINDFLDGETISFDTVKRAKGDNLPPNFPVIPNAEMIK